LKSAARGPQSSLSISSGGFTATWGTATNLKEVLKNAQLLNLFDHTNGVIPRFIAMKAIVFM